jgi:rubrerythrin
MNYHLTEVGKAIREAMGLGPYPEVTRMRRLVEAKKERDAAVQEFLNETIYCEVCGHEYKRSTGDCPHCGHDHPKEETL